MPICSTCGGPDHLRCNCVVVPYCDQCNENANCNSEMDSACVIYHPTYPGFIPPATNLINLGLPNGSSAQTIFDAIDAKFGSTANTPIIPLDTNTLDLTVGLDGRTLSGNVIIDPTVGNLLSATANGLLATNPNPNFFVKVDANDSPDYLFNQVVGDTTVDGCISIDVLDNSGTLVIRPTFNAACFASALCSSNLGVREQLANCLLTAGLQANDTATVDLNLSTTTPNVLTANVKVSVTAGNNITVNSDGLFVGNSGTVNAANNGLSITGNTVQMGGPLIKNTDIDFATFNLKYHDNPVLYMGEGTPGTGANFQIENTYVVSGGKTSAATISTTGTFASTGLNGIFGLLEIDGGAQTDAINSIKSAIHGEMRINATGAVTLAPGCDGYAGVVGVMFKENAGSVSVDNIVSNGTFVAFASDAGNVSRWAAIRARGINTAPTGAVYTGTVADYYGLYIDDITTSDYGARITNKHAIFQEGSTMTNSFSTGVVVTSDERVKTGFESYTRGLDEIEKINTLKFHFKDNTTGDKRVGVIAQEIEKIIPEAVVTEKSHYYNIEDFKKLDTDTLIFTLINAVKELSDKVKVLELK